MKIDTVKLLNDIGYKNSKATATKLFGKYSCEIELAKEIILEQSTKSGKYQQKFIELLETGIESYIINNDIEIVEKQKENTQTFISDGSEHIKTVRHLVYDNIFVKLAEDKENGIKNAKLLIEKLNELY